MIKFLKDTLSKNLVIIVAAIVILVLGFFGYNIVMNSLKTIKQSNFVLSGNLISDQHKIEPPLGRSEIEQLIQNYVINHPEIIVESLEGLQQSKVREQNEKISLKIKEKRTELFDTASNLPFAGNKDAKIKLIAFMDYNCSYCKKSNDALNQLLATDQDISIIYRIHPILGEGSEYLAKVVLTINKIMPEKFKQVHDKLMNGKIETKNDLIKILEESDIKFSDIEDKINDIKDQLTSSAVLAKYIGVGGVPALIINDKLYTGFVDIKNLQNIIQEVKTAINITTLDTKEQSAAYPEDSIKKPEESMV